MALSPTAVFESFNPLHSSWSCVLESPLEVHSAQTLNEVVPLLQEADRAAHNGLWAAFLLSYEAAPAFDSAMEVHRSEGFPLGWLAVFREPSSRACHFNPETIPSPRWNPSIARGSYATGIATIRGAIARGDCYQVNYTFPMECQFQGDAGPWYRALGAAQGAGYSAWIDLGRYQGAVFFAGAFLRAGGKCLEGAPDEGHCTERTLGFRRRGATEQTRGICKKSSRKSHDC